MLKTLAALAALTVPVMPETFTQPQQDYSGTDPKCVVYATTEEVKQALVEWACAHAVYHYRSTGCLVFDFSFPSALLHVELVPHGQDAEKQR